MQSVKNGQKPNQITNISPFHQQIMLMYGKQPFRVILLTDYCCITTCTIKLLCTICFWDAQLHLNFCPFSLLLRFPHVLIILVFLPGKLNLCTS